MSRLPADIRISLKKRGGQTYRIGLSGSPWDDGIGSAATESIPPRCLKRRRRKSLNVFAVGRLPAVEPSESKPPAASTLPRASFVELHCGNLWAWQVPKIWHSTPSVTGNMELPERPPANGLVPNPIQLYVPLLGFTLCATR